MGSILNPQGAGSAETTMSSREIADICEARHDDVIATIERLIDDGVLRLPRNSGHAHQSDGAGRPNLVYDLARRDCLVVISGYGSALRASIIDRWMELEPVTAPRTATVPPSFGAALRLAAEQQDVIDAQASRLAAAAAAVEFVERYTHATGMKGFRQVAKLLGANENLFREFLIDRKIMYRLGRELTPHAQHIDAGRFCVRAGTADTGHAYNAARFTAKGVAWVAGEWAKHQEASRRKGGQHGA